MSSHLTLFYILISLPIWGAFKNNFWFIFDKFQNVYDEVPAMLSFVITQEHLFCWAYWAIIFDWNWFFFKYMFLRKKMTTSCFHKFYNVLLEINIQYWLNDKISKPFLKLFFISTFNCQKFDIKSMFRIWRKTHYQFFDTVLRYCFPNYLQPAIVVISIVVIVVISICPWRLYNGTSRAQVMYGKPTLPPPLPYRYI